MADTKISGLTALGAAPATNDLLTLVDVSDTTMAASGTNKSMTVANIQTLVTSTANTFTAAQTNQITDAGTTTVVYPVVVDHQSSGTPAAGMGVGIAFDVETSAANTERGATIEAVTTDVTGASEDFALVAKTMVAGSTTLVEGARAVGASWRVPSGSSSALSLAFTAAPTYGFYLESSVLVGVVAGGTVNTYFGSSGTQQRVSFRSNSASVDNNRMYGQTRLVTASTAGSGAPKVLGIDESSTIWTNEGATAQNYYTLTTAAAGLQYEFAVQDADGIRIVAGAGDTIRDGTTGSAAAGFIQSTVIGSTLRIVAINATEWFVMSKQGTWTVDI